MIRKIAIVVFAGVASHCVTTRTIVKRPALAVTVVDETGRPMPGANVVVSHITHPYGRLESAEAFTADAAGNVATTEITERERVMPLCMHGVPGHSHTVCAEVPGKGAVVHRYDPDSGGTIVLKLDPNAPAGCTTKQPGSGTGSPP